MTEIFDPNRKTFEEILKEFDVTIDINKGGINKGGSSEEPTEDDSTQQPAGPDDGDTLG